MQRKKSTTFTVRRWWRYCTARLPSVHILISHPGAKMSQSAECCAAFVSGGTQVNKNTARYELLLRACAFTYGWKRSEGGLRNKVSYVKKLFMEYILLAILLINVYQL